MSDQELAAVAVGALRGPFRRHQSGIAIKPSPDGPEFELPESVLPALSRALELLAEGRTVSVLATDEELTTQQVADLLNVSRPYVVQLLEDGKIPYRMVGTKRRIRSVDAVRFKEHDDQERDAASRRLIEESQRLGLY
jgi:excisionase family DNA binding protein